MDKRPPPATLIIFRKSTQAVPSTYLWEPTLAIFIHHLSVCGKLFLLSDTFNGTYQSWSAGSPTSSIRPLLSSRVITYVL